MGGLRPRSASTLSGLNQFNKKGDNGQGALTKTMKERDQLLVRIKQLQEELQLALMAAEDINALKGKLKASCAHLDNEKRSHLRTQDTAMKMKNKMVCYADHLENLVGEIKILSKSRMNIITAARELAKKKRKVDDENKLMRRQLLAKDKLIKELRETNHILHNQLGLMDEQMQYVRKNIDSVRVAQRTQVNRATKEAKILREKFAAATGASLDEMASPQDLGVDSEGASFFQKFKGNHGKSSIGFSPSPGKVRPKSAGVGATTRGGDRGSNNQYGNEHTSRTPGTAPTTPSSPSSPKHGTNLQLISSEAMSAHIGAMSHEKKEQALGTILDKVHDKQRIKAGENKKWTNTSIHNLAYARDPPSSPNKAKTKDSTSSRPKTAGTMGRTA